MREYHEIENRQKQPLFIGIAVGVLVGGWQLQAEDADNLVRPKVVRMQGDLNYYQHIVLDNASFAYYEQKNTLGCWSDYVDYDFSKDANNQLMAFSLSIHANPSRTFKSVPGRSALTPQHDLTSYSDLDGDTVLDTMWKNGPNRSGRGLYILYKNTWIEVNNSRIGLAIGSTATAVLTQTTYIFKKP